MARFQYKQKDVYFQYVRNWGKKPRPCDCCSKPIAPKVGQYYQTHLGSILSTLIELGEIPSHVHNSLDDEFFCTLKCLKEQCVKHGGKKLKEYIDIANQKIKNMSQEEYSNYAEYGLFK